MYGHKMAAHAYNDKLLMHCFQESLTSGPLRWYIQLEGSCIRTWGDLATTFLAQFRHVTELALDRLTLQSFKKESTESFRTYARRWREAAMDVQPPLTERELTTLFISTMKGVYYKKLVENVSISFAVIVASKERIECGIKEGNMNEGKAEVPVFEW